jgi:hypothetical protein
MKVLLLLLAIAVVVTAIENGKGRTPVRYAFFITVVFYAYFIHGHCLI